MYMYKYIHIFLFFNKLDSSLLRCSGRENHFASLSYTLVYGERGSSGEGAEPPPPPGTGRTWTDGTGRTGTRKKVLIRVELVGFNFGLYIIY